MPFKLVSSNLPVGHGWIVLGGKRYAQSNVDRQCVQLVQNMSQGLTPAAQLVITHAGCTVIGQDSLAVDLHQRR
jgi:hypothetical protein